jgi:hypothetical protein
MKKSVLLFVILVLLSITVEATDRGYRGDAPAQNKPEIATPDPGQSETSPGNLKCEDPQQIIAAKDAQIAAHQQTIAAKDAQIAALQQQQGCGELQSKIVECQNDLTQCLADLVDCGCPGSSSSTDNRQLRTPR